MEPLQILALSLIQGITEFLPISSSGHLVLASGLLGWPDQGLAFDVAVHAGSLLAVLICMRRDVLGIANGLWLALRGRGFNAQAALGMQVAIATLPIVVIGLAAGDFVAQHLRTTTVIAVTTIIFGILLLLADHVGRRRHDNKQPAATAMNWRNALLIGIAQTLALIPGTSRSGITMTAALLLGLSRQDSARFSFLLAIPTILGASLLSLPDVLDEPATGIAQPADLALGFILSTVIACGCVQLFLRTIERIGFLPFVIYRLALGALLLL